VRRIFRHELRTALARTLPTLVFGAACAVFVPIGCSGSSGNQGQNESSEAGPDTATTPESDSSSTMATLEASTSDDSPQSSPPPTATADATTPPSPAVDAGVGTWDGGAYPAGWLYTNGGKIYLSNGGSPATQWMGRGVNVDDIFLCGYNNTLGMASSDKTLEMEIAGLMSAWKPTFLRISLGMNSYSVASWLKNPAQYKTPMTNVINAIGAYPHVHVLVTLRSDKSMIGEVSTGDSEATGLPSDSSSTPDKTAFPTGTDATYVALVDTFANSSFVMFGLTNEPGGNTLKDDQIAAAMNHAVGTIRAEEDRLKVPHHIVSVQGNGWSSDISFYAKTPAVITHDNVVYEVHGYPPPTSGYTYPNIPVILGEYGYNNVTSGDTTDMMAAKQLYADLESKQIPNLAWDFESYSDCGPDLLTVTHNASMLTPTPWGSIVQPYLLAHAP
jgi:hypothetical protein